jgi:hypothetical protein
VLAIITAWFSAADGEVMNAADHSAMIARPTNSTTTTSPAPLSPGPALTGRGKS